MNKKCIVGLAGVLALGLFSSAAADIKGKVYLKGDPPAERKLPFDPQCAKLIDADSTTTTTFYIVGDNKELADVFVSLDNISNKSTGPSQDPGVLDQEECVYKPYVLAIQTGQTLVVKNSDPVLHNVHPTPKPGTANKEANKAQLPNGPDLTFTFPAAEDFLRFKCDIHPWMFAYVNVVDHPYHAVTDKDGVFVIKDVPPGKHNVVAQHRKAGTVSKVVEVKDSDVEVEFVIELQ